MKKINNSTIGNSAYSLRAKKMCSLPVLFLLGFIGSASASFFYPALTLSIYPPFDFEDDKSNNEK